jgi:predicted amidohydrolase YtcJ
MDAFAAIAAAVVRHPWSPEETLSAEDAIRAYCMGSAYAGFAEGWSGSLEAGKVADFVVLSEDITAAPPDRIWKMRAEQVWVAGKRAV